jgi:diguanylate cyclase (GGDEF)-like protein
MQSCQVLQLTCQILNQPHEPWHDIFSEFKNHQFDLIGPIHTSGSRQPFINFSAPHHLPTSVLVKRIGYKDNVYRYLSELITERIGVIHGDFAIEKLSQSLPQKEFYYFEHQQALIDALVTNTVDYIALDRTTLNQLLRDKNYLYIEEDRHVGALYSSSIAFGFNKTARGALLADYFTMAMDVIDTESIVSKYDTQPAWRNLYNTEQDYSARVVYISISFATFAIIALAFLHYQSTTDQLTGLKNRRALERRFSSGVPLGVQVLYIDVNRFKKLNDQMGHAFGDYVLKCVAGQIKHRWRGKAYRIGGDEFILIGRFDDTYVRSFVENFRTIPVQRIGYPPTTISLSIGVSQGKYNGCDFQAVLKEADLAMYHDKASDA